MKKQRMLQEPEPTRQQPHREEHTDQEKAPPQGSASGVSDLHRHIGNRGVQRLLAQRTGDGGYELDERTASRVERERSGGQPLDAAVQAQMSQALGYDMSGVNVHTSPEADALNRQLGAKAFTTGEDVFFREGTYDPHSAAGQELIAHELTHVAQQGTGAVKGSSRMTVGAPGDVHEQQADATAHSLVSAGAHAPVQQQEEEEEIQAQIEEEEELLQPQEEEEVIQGQEEKEIQMQVEEEEEEELLQPQEEEEEIQAQAEDEEEEEEEEPIQAQEEEEEMMP